MAHEYQKGLANEYVNEEFKAVFADVALSKFAVGPYDNDEPKYVKVYVKWTGIDSKPRTQTRPAVGDHVSMYLKDFEVPCAVAWTDPEADAPNDQAHQPDGNQPRERDFNEREEENHRQKMRHTWSAIALPDDPDCPATHIPFMAHRPFDNVSLLKLVLLGLI